MKKAQFHLTGSILLTMFGVQVSSLQGFWLGLIVISIALYYTMANMGKLAVASRKVNDGNEELARVEFGSALFNSVVISIVIFYSINTALSFI